MDKQATVIYHSADYDGIFCREIARRFMPDASLVGWNFGDAPVAVPDGPIYVLDLPVDEPFGFKWDFDLHSSRFANDQRIVWIDHHKSSIQSHPTSFPGLRIDGVAACRLAWQWFSGFVNHFGNDTPTKADFVERRVTEPLSVRLAGEYDIWDKRDPRAETLQFGLQLVDQDADFWEALLDCGPVGDKAVQELLAHGESIQRYSQKTDASICNSRTWLMEWEGLRWLCVNSARFNSLFFAAKDKPETGHDALLGFCYNGKVWTVSMYHAKHRVDLDLSVIAVKHGGGGHRGACGFTCEVLLFEL